MIAFAQPDRHVDVFGGEVRDLHGRRYARVDLGMGVEEAPQPRHQPFGHQPRRRRDDQHVAVARAVELRHRAAHAFEAGMQAGIDQPAGIGQLDRAGAAVKQRQAELLLQRADLVAERGGRDVQFVGRLGEAQMAGDRLEGAQRIERRKRLAHD